MHRDITEVLTCPPSNTCLCLLSHYIHITDDYLSIISSRFCLRYMTLYIWQYYPEGFMKMKNVKYLKLDVSFFVCIFTSWKSFQDPRSAQLALMLGFYHFLIL